MVEPGDIAVGAASVVTTAWVWKYKLAPGGPVCVPFKPRTFQTYESPSVIAPDGTVKLVALAPTVYETNFEVVTS